MPGLNGTPQVGEKAVLVMCADHGVWDEGVAVSPKIVTAIQAANMTRGTTGVCVLAAQAGAKVHVIDVGIDAEPIPGVVDMRARGCGNIAVGPAMSRSQAEALCWRFPATPATGATRRDLIWRRGAGNGEHYASRRDGQRFYRK